LAAFSVAGAGGVFRRPMGWRAGSHGGGVRVRSDRLDRDGAGGRSLPAPGIATRLVERSLQYLDAQGVQTARLDATPLGRPCMNGLAFWPSTSCCECRGPSPRRAPIPRSSRCLPTGWRGLRSGRGSHRNATTAADPAAVRGASGVGDGAVRGRGSGRLCVLAPRQAGRTDRPGGCDLHCGRRRDAGPDVGTLPCRPVFADVPADNRAAVEWAEARGFVVQREYTRMYRGRRITDLPQRIWASSGPEKG